MHKSIVRTLDTPYIPAELSEHIAYIGGITTFPIGAICSLFCFVWIFAFFVLTVVLPFFFLPLQSAISSSMWPLVLPT